jgi:phosphoribosyl 1,2-cyclic phosphate phosphodiesterase
MPRQTIKKVTIKFLGTSSGESIPRLGCDCEQCTSLDKKDQRLRPSILINKKILVDAGPDILKQLRKNQIENLELVLVTHEHFDHTSGIKDLLKIKRNLEIVRLAPGQHFKWEGLEFYAFKVNHSKVVTTVGLEIGPMIYIPDFADLNLAQKYLKESKIAVLDGSVLNRSFDGHLAINETINQTKILKNLRRIYFTHNGHTHCTHKEMVKTVKALGDDRYGLVYDGLEINL